MIVVLLLDGADILNCSVKDELPSFRQFRIKEVDSRSRKLSWPNQISIVSVKQISDIQKKRQTKQICTLFYGYICDLETYGFLER